MTGDDRAARQMDRPARLPAPPVVPALPARRDRTPGSKHEGDPVGDIVLVFAGGGIGAVVRYLVGLFGAAAGFGVGTSTLAINLAGSFLIGTVFSLVGRNILSHSVHLLLMTGFLGGFTTFSTYTLDIVSTLRTGRIGSAVFLALLANLGGFLCAAAGILAGERLFPGA